MSVKSSGGGISFLGMLAILFIGLRLTGHINWAWWWVLAPLWGPAAFFLTLMAGCLVLFAIAGTLDGIVRVVASVKRKLDAAAKEG